MSGIFRKKEKKPSFKDGYCRANVNRQIVSEDVEKNDCVTKVISIKDVDTSKLPPLPSSEEFDLEQQLKNGVKPQLINVRGILGDDFDPSVAMSKLMDYADAEKVEPVVAKEDVKE